MKVTALDGTGAFDAYTAGDGPAGVVVVQEILGVNAGIRGMVDGWAADGYRAAAPDLFWRLEPGVELDADDPAQFQRGLDLAGKFDFDHAVADIEATIRALRAAGCARVGVVGYCLGGHLAFLAATRTDSDASVGYYGVYLDQRLGEAHAIANPLMLHVATRDGFVPPETQAKVHAALADNRHVTIHDYDADHAFARAAPATSRVDALAEQADARTRAFFSEYLK